MNTLIIIVGAIGVLAVMLGTRDRIAKRLVVAGALVAVLVTLSVYMRVNFLESLYDDTERSLIELRALRVIAADHIEDHPGARGDITARLVATGRIADRWRAIKGPELWHPWNGPVRVLAEGRQFSIRLEEVPANGCAALARRARHPLLDRREKLAIQPMATPDANGCAAMNTLVLTLPANQPGRITDWFDTHMQ